LSSINIRDNKKEIQVIYWIGMTWIKRSAAVFILFNIVTLIIMILRMIKRKKGPILMKNKYIIGIFLIGIFLSILILHEYIYILKTLPENKLINLIAREEAHETMTILILLLIVIWGLLIINYFLYIFIKKRYLSLAKMKNYVKSP
jgi:RsiW-degrading membrane proteinase PrsW (M82 family)